ncbi:MAG: hypothetical protein Kow00127_09970 [Bacteroidales bacterium]
MHPFAAPKALRITKEVPEMVSQYSAAMCNHPDGQTDALTHGVWMALLTRQIGERKAVSLGQAHERQNRRTARRNYKRNRPSHHDAAAMEMDLFNNRQGAETARTVSAPDSLLPGIIAEEVLNGKFRVVRHDAAGNFLDESGNIIGFEDWGYLWKNSRVLVTSDKAGR